MMNRSFSTRFSGAFLALGTIAIAAVMAENPRPGRTGGAPEEQSPDSVSDRSWFATRSMTVDTAARSSVAEFYRDHYVPHDRVTNEWSGSTTGCRAGRNSPQYDEATLRNLKYYRAMAGVPADVSFDPGYNEKAMAAALMMEAKNDLSHGPTPSWPCYSDAGKKGASSSNLCLGCVGPSAIDAYIQDSGVQGVGHRQWALHPRQKVLGNGSTKRAHALYVFGDWRSEEEVADVKHVAWPPAGFVPYRFGLDGNYPWSYFSFEENADYSRVKVKMYRDGRPIALRQEAGATGHAVWYPTGLGRATYQNDYNRPDDDVLIKVEIANVLIDGKSKQLEYTVTFIDPVSVLAESDTDSDPNDPEPETSTEEGIEENENKPEQVTIDPAMSLPLLKAIFAGKSSEAIGLLEKGADPNARYREKWTALMYAAYYGRLQIAEALLARGADSTVTLDGWDAAAMAESQRHTAIADLIRKESPGSTRQYRTRSMRIPGVPPPGN